MELIKFSIFPKLPIFPIFEALQGSCKEKAQKGEEALMGYSLRFRRGEETHVSYCPRYLSR